MKYRRNKNGQFSSKPNLGLGFGWLVLLACLLVTFLVTNQKNCELISPLVENPVQPAYAQEKVVIKCELGVEEYLECQAAQGKITHDQARVMLAIAKAESGLREDAVNVNKGGSIDRGVFQLNSIHKDISNKDAFDWKKNTDYALKMMKKQGYTPWVAYLNGSYKKFL